MILYFTKPVKENREVMQRRWGVGCIVTAFTGGHKPQGSIWCVDNGCFAPERWDEQVWWKHLEKMAAKDVELCIFASAPDVVGDAQATLERSRPWLPKIRALGYPVAFVFQYGFDQIDVPWDEFDVLFVGGGDKGGHQIGTASFKFGAVAKAAVDEARARGKWVHYGRVNSYKRMRYAEAIGCHTADGTQLGFRPSQTFPQVIGWYHTMRSQEALFDLTDAEHGES